MAITQLHLQSSSASPSLGYLGRALPHFRGSVSSSMKWGQYHHPWLSALATVSSGSFHIHPFAVSSPGPSLLLPHFCRPSVAPCPEVTGSFGSADLARLPPPHLPSAPCPHPSSMPPKFRTCPIGLSMPCPSSLPGLCISCCLCHHPGPSGLVRGLPLFAPDHIRHLGG